MLISLKHKRPGEAVGTLSTDFWKSVRIWLDRYVRDGKLACEPGGATTAVFLVADLPIPTALGDLESI